MVVALEVEVEAGAGPRGGTRGGLRRGWTAGGAERGGAGRGRKMLVAREGDRSGQKAVLKAGGVAVGRSEDREME